MNASPEILHNAAVGRFEVRAGSDVAVLDYSVADRTITFVHTGVPSEMEGRGVGSRLARAGLEYARREGLKVVPQCPFIRSYMERHEEYRSLL